MVVVQSPESSHVSMVMVAGDPFTATKTEADEPACLAAKRPPCRLKQLTSTGPGAEGPLPRTWIVLSTVQEQAPQQKEPTGPHRPTTQSNTSTLAPRGCTAGSCHSLGWVCAPIPPSRLLHRHQHISQCLSMCSFQSKEVKLWGTRAATRPLGPAAHDHGQRGIWPFVAAFDKALASYRPALQTSRRLANVRASFSTCHVHTQQRHGAGNVTCLEQTCSSVRLTGLPRAAQETRAEEATAWVKFKQSNRQPCPDQEGTRVPRAKS